MPDRPKAIKADGKIYLSGQHGTTIWPLEDFPGTRVLLEWTSTLVLASKCLHETGHRDLGEKVARIATECYSQTLD